MGSLISLKNLTDSTISGLCDSDWGGGTTNRKSRIGILVYIGGTLVTWHSGKQGALARFSTEAEYWAIASTLEEIEGVKSLLTATFIANNPICHAKLKHVTMDLQFARERTEQS